MEAMEGWSPYLKMALFSPLFVSHSIYEARGIYKAFEHLLHVPFEDEQKLRFEPVGATEINLEPVDENTQLLQTEVVIVGNNTDVDIV